MQMSTSYEAPDAVVVMFDPGKSDVSCFESTVAIGTGKTGDGTETYQIVEGNPGEGIEIA